MISKEMSKQDIKSFIVWYINASADEKNPKDFKLYDKLIHEEPDITEELLRSEDSPESFRSSYYVKNILFKLGRCQDIALQEAELMTDEFIFLEKDYQLERWNCEWEPEDEIMLKKWLLCQCEEPPAVLPARCDFHYLLHHDYMEELFAAMSVVCDFPVRYLAYVIYRGTLYQVKYPLRSLVIYREQSFADSLVDTICKINQDYLKIPADEYEEKLMNNFAAIYCGGDKKKLETAFLKKNIDKWMNDDQEKFISCIREKMNPDLRKKVLKKLSGASK